MSDLKFLQISDDIGEIEDEVLNIYWENSLFSEKDDLVKNLEAIRQDEDIIIAFIGQYSAGKSTIISALTGNRNIKINANIATEKAKRYKWVDQITLVDTPGLHTENKHHDLEAEKAINNSNMLIYCITNELFDEVSIVDYKKWVYDRGYKDKMFLVVNKMSRETGDFEELVVNYTESINEALKPYSLQDVRYNFIDARDYLDGTLDPDLEELVELSRFKDFTSNLNEFIDEKGLLAKLDTPIKVIINSIDSTLNSLSGKETDQYLISLLDRVYKRTNYTINQIEKKSKHIVKENLNTFVAYGYNIAQNIGNEDFVFNEFEFEQKLEEVGLVINDEINKLLETESQDLAEEIRDVLESDLGKIYIKAISKEPEYNHLDLTSKDNTNNFLKVIDSISRPGVRNFFSSKGFSLAATSSEVSGTALHQTVKVVGNNLGVKFKPWQAVNIAKNLGKFFSGVTVVLNIVSLFSDMKETGKEEEQYNQLWKQKQEMRTIVTDIAKEIEKEYYIQVQSAIEEYEEILDKIKMKKENKLKEIDRQKVMEEKLETEKQKLKELQKNIFGNA